MKIQEIVLGDCLDELEDYIQTDPYSINLLLTDLPYEKTKLGWDTQFDLKRFWNIIPKLMTNNGAVVMTTSQPFTTKVINSQPDLFKQNLIWLKTRPSNVFNAKKMFMNWHEDILVFYYNLPTFNPQMVKGEPYYRKNYSQDRSLGIYDKTGEHEVWERENKGERYPKSVLEFSNPNHNSLHPTQKPVELFEYLIKTYSNEGDTVLDCCAGSGTTAIACLNTKRNYICIEKEPKYFEIMKKRISENDKDELK